MEHLSRRGLSTAGDRAEAQGERLIRQEQFEWLARAGLAARGVVYAIIGILAIKLALGDGGNAPDQQGALQTIARQPFGKVLLAITAVGLAGYAVWRLVRAALGHGPEDHHDDAKDRISALVSGIAYTALCVTAVKLLAGSGGSGSTARHPGKTASGVLGWPAGRVLVVVVGLVIIGVAIDQGLKGVRKKFVEDAKTGEMSRAMRRVYTAVGMFGHLARMVVFGLIGYFLIRAAIDYAPNKAVGLDGALARLGQSSYGPTVLGIVAAGLIGFAAYSLLDARYRKV